jgi:hypothetical protein
VIRHSRLDPAKEILTVLICSCVEDRAAAPADVRIAEINIDTGNHDHFTARRILCTGWGTDEGLLLTRPNVGSALAIFRVQQIIEQHTWSHLRDRVGFAFGREVAQNGIHVHVRENCAIGLGRDGPSTVFVLLHPLGIPDRNMLKRHEQLAEGAVDILGRERSADGDLIRLHS